MCSLKNLFSFEFYLSIFKCYGGMKEPCPAHSNRFLLKWTFRSTNILVLNGKYDSGTYISFYDNSTNIALHTK